MFSKVVKFIAGSKVWIYLTTILSVIFYGKYLISKNEELVETIEDLKNEKDTLSSSMDNKRLHDLAKKDMEHEATIAPTTPYS